MFSKKLFRIGLERPSFKEIFNKKTPNLIIGSLDFNLELDTLSETIALLIEVHRCLKSYKE